MALIGLLDRKMIKIILIAIALIIFGLIKTSYSQTLNAGDRIATQLGICQIQREQQVDQIAGLQSQIVKLQDELKKIKEQSKEESK